MKILAVIVNMPGAAKLLAVYFAIWVALVFFNFFFGYQLPRAVRVRPSLTASQLFYLLQDPKPTVESIHLTDTNQIPSLVVMKSPQEEYELKMPLSEPEYYRLMELASKRKVVVGLRKLTETAWEQYVVDWTNKERVDQFVKRIVEKLKKEGLKQ